MQALYAISDEQCAGLAFAPFQQHLPSGREQVCPVSFTSISDGMVGPFASPALYKVKQIDLLPPFNAFGMYSAL